MTHREIIVGDEFPYHRTDVPFDRSMAAIMGMLLAARGVVKVAPLYENVGEVQRITLMVETEQGAQFLIHFPTTYRRQRKGTPPKLDMRIAGRMMFFHIKDMLLMAEVAYLSFTQVFSPYLALPDVDGRPKPLMDFLPDVEEKVQASRPLIPYLNFEMQQLEDKRRPGP
ncbi:MAG: hypothetical protein WC683_07405 [bacterium]